MENIFQDIHSYNDKLTISQVVKFFEKKGIRLTKSMIQNYVRDGVLPPPVNKRHYTAGHLATLFLVDYLKQTFEVAEIKAALAPFVDENGLSPENFAMLRALADAQDASYKAVTTQVLSDGPKDNETGLLLLMLHAAESQALARLFAEKHRLH